MENMNLNNIEDKDINNVNNLLNEENKKNNMDKFLFRPVTTKGSIRDPHSFLDHVSVPFKVVGNRVYYLYTFGRCIDKTTYIMFEDLNKDGQFEDITPFYK